MTIDRAALREKARAYWCGRCVTSPGTLESPCEMCGSISGTVLALLDALDAAERERDQARADLRKYGGHCPGLAGCASYLGGAPCDCGYAEALARADDDRAR